MHTLPSDAPETPRFALFLPPPPLDCLGAPIPHPNYSTPGDAFPRGAVEAFGLEVYLFGIHAVRSRNVCLSATRAHLCVSIARVCVIGIGTGEFGFFSRGKRALLCDGSFCSAVLILVSAFVSKERNVARCLGPLVELLRLFARQPSSRLEDSLSRLGLACHVFIRLGCILPVHVFSLEVKRATSYAFAFSRDPLQKTERESIAFSPKMLGCPGVFIAASGNIVSGNVAGVEAMPKPSLVALPQVALGCCTLGTFWRGCRSPSMGSSSPVWGFPPRPQTSPFLAIAETLGGDPSLGQPSEMALHSFGKPRTRERACAYECGHYSPNGTLSPGIVVCLVGKQILLFHSRSFQLFFLSILHRRFFTIFPVHLYEAGVSPTTRENFTERDSESEEIIPRWALEHG